MKRFAVWMVVASALLALAVGTWAMRARRARSTQPLAAGALRGANVLLVTIDTLRADHVGAYGSTGGMTPTLDRLAAEGLRFETTYAHVPLTLPSHATIMTGLYPFTNGVRDNGSFRFDGARPTLAGAAPPPAVGRAPARGGVSLHAAVRGAPPGGPSHRDYSPPPPPGAGNLA